MRSSSDIKASDDAILAVPGLPPVEIGGPEGPPLAPAHLEPVARSQWQLFLRRFLKHKLAVAALVVLILLYIVCFFAPQLAPYPLNPKLTSEVLAGASKGPSAAHWFGTDELGRDQLTRIMYAGQISLRVGLFVALASTLIGTALGSVAGFFGGWVDQLLMRVTDLFLVVPGLAILAMAHKRLSGKSILGFGIQPPAVSWGTMLNQSEGAVGTPQAYLIYFPGLALLVTVLAVNFLGDGLRDAFDPQSQH